MDIPAAFRHQMMATFAEDSTAWLSRLPALIDAYARRWALCVGPAFANLVPRDELCNRDRRPAPLRRRNLRAPACVRPRGRRGWQHSLACAELLAQS